MKKRRNRVPSLRALPSDPPVPAVDRMYEIGDFARIALLDDSTVYRRVKDGEIRGVTRSASGRKMRFPRSEALRCREIVRGVVTEKPTEKPILFGQECYEVLARIEQHIDRQNHILEAQLDLWRPKEPTDADRPRQSTGSTVVPGRAEAGDVHPAEGAPLFNGLRPTQH